MTSAEADRHPEAGQTHSAILFRAQDVKSTVVTSGSAGITSTLGPLGTDHKVILDLWVQHAITLAPTSVTSLCTSPAFDKESFPLVFMFSTPFCLLSIKTKGPASVPLLESIHGGVLSSKQDGCVCLINLRVPVSLC